MPKRVQKAVRYLQKALMKNFETASKKQCLDLGLGGPSFYLESGEALAKPAQRCCGCPISEGAQGHGWDLGQPELVGYPPMAGSWNWMGFEIPSKPSHSVML